MMDKAAALQQGAAKFVATIDPVELAVRLAETYNEMKRPVGASALEAFFAMEKDAQDAWLSAAIAAMDYWKECIESANNTQ